MSRSMPIISVRRVLRRTNRRRIAALCCGRADDALVESGNVNVDALIVGFDRALRTLFVSPTSARRSPGDSEPEASLTARERTHAAALMRVNHVGEVCAQALYQGQAMALRDADDSGRTETGGHRGNRSIWPGPKGESGSWAGARVCSIRCGTPGPCASAPSPADSGTRATSAFWPRPKRRSVRILSGTCRCCRDAGCEVAGNCPTNEGRRTSACGEREDDSARSEVPFALKLGDEGGRRGDDAGCLLRLDLLRQSRSRG